MTVRFIRKPTPSGPLMLDGKPVSLSEAASILDTGLATVMRHTSGKVIDAAAIRALTPGEPLTRPRPKPKPVNPIIPKAAKPTKRARTYTFAGKTMTLAEWAEETGLPQSLIYSRIEVNSWEIDRALTQPMQQQRRHIPLRNRTIIRRIATTFHEARA